MFIATLCVALLAPSPAIAESYCLKVYRTASTQLVLAAQYRNTSSNDARRKIYRKMVHNSAGTGGKIDEPGTYLDSSLGPSQFGVAEKPRAGENPFGCDKSALFRASVAAGTLSMIEAFSEEPLLGAWPIDQFLQIDNWDRDNRYFLTDVSAFEDTGLNRNMVRWLLTGYVASFAANHKALDVTPLEVQALQYWGVSIPSP